MKSISVVIPSYNSWAFIEPCLEALDDELNWESDEVIVVDSSDQAAPQELLRRFGRVQWHFHKQRLFPGAARNLGFRKTRNDWLVFLDSDVVVQTGWRSAINELSDDTIAAGGPVDPAAPASVWGLARYWIEFGQFSTNNLRESAWNIPSCNMLWRRAAFEQTKGFPEDFRSADDLLFNYQNMKFRGRSYTLVPGMKVTHPVSANSSDVKTHLLTVGFWSGQARQQGVKPSPGRSTIWLPLLFLYRFAQVWRRYNRASTPRTAKSLLRPIAKGTLWWCLGFSEGVRSKMATETQRHRE